MLMLIKDMSFKFKSCLGDSSVQRWQQLGNKFPFLFSCVQLDEREFLIFSVCLPLPAIKQWSLSKNRISDLEMPIGGGGWAEGVGPLAEIPEICSN